MGIGNAHMNMIKVICDTITGLISTTLSWLQYKRRVPGPGPKPSAWRPDPTQSGPLPVLTVGSFCS
jgi:hypothetical protein